MQLLDELIVESDASRIPIVVEALARGADLTRGAVPSGQRTHGSRPSLQPWHPRLWKDAFDYVFACLDRLSTLALRAKTLLAFGLALAWPIRSERLQRPAMLIGCVAIKVIYSSLFII